MSSRSNSPRPPPSNRGNGQENRGGTLSNDALYAPLSSYAAVCSSKSHNNDASSSAPSKKKKTHSLSLQTNSNLRESSLVAFLTSTSQSLKTTHPQECQLYRGMGGSIARFGMGDNDRADSSMRGLLEGKLLNRSLVLVGGGVHSNIQVRKNSDREANNAVGLGMAQTTSNGKRERKRLGGNGIFGCVSNKKRKRALNQSLLEEESMLSDKCDLKNGSERKLGATQKDGQPHTKFSGKSKQMQCNLTPTDIKEKVGSVIETLHDMWISYIRQLLLPVQPRANYAATTSVECPASLSLTERKQISCLLANAEHVGMPATIVDCPSRRHLLQSRCLVVNETKETWKFAMIKQKGLMKGLTLEERGQALDSGEKGDGITKTRAVPSHLWNIVMVPKRGTALEVDLPWKNSPPSPGTPNGSQPIKSRIITVRLES